MGSAYPVHSGKGGDLFENVGEGELSLIRYTEPQDSQVFSIETHIYGEDAGEGASEEAGTHKNDDGEGDLKRYEAASEEYAPARGSLSGTPKSELSFSPTRQEGRCEAEENARSHPAPAGGQEDRPGYFNLPDGRSSRSQGDQDTRPHHREQEANGAAQEAQQDALGQKLAHDPVLAGTESLSGEDFSAAPDGLTQEKRGQIAAGDDEEEDRRNREEKDLPAESACLHLFPRYEADLGSIDMVAHLREHGVAVRPGAEFGASGEHHLRLSYAASDEAIVQGVARLAAGLSALA